MELIQKGDRDIELTVLDTTDATVTNKLDDFFVPSKYDSAAVAAAKADARAGVYDATTPYTTRPPREGEQDGVHYHFVNEERFKEMLDAGAFLEWGMRGEHYYGTPKAFNPRPSRHASRARQSLRRSRNAVQTVVVGRRADGSFGLELEGGLSEGVVPHVAEVADDCRLVAFTERRLLPGDVVLAVNGVSIAGFDLRQIRHLLQGQGDEEVELTAMCVNRTGPTSFRKLLSSASDGRGGAGATTDPEFAAVLRDVRTDVYRSTVPYTTRAPREGERNGIDYVFVSEEEFRQMEKEGKFIEVGESNGVLYGTPTQSKPSFKPRASRTRRRLSTRSRFSRPRVFVIEADGSDVSVRGERCELHVRTHGLASTLHLSHKQHVKEKKRKE